MLLDFTFLIVSWWHFSEQNWQKCRLCQRFRLSELF